jgi:hypothetical protein
MRCKIDHPELFGYNTPVDRWFFEFGACHPFEFYGGESIHPDHNSFKTESECLFTCSGDPCLKNSLLSTSWKGGAYLDEETKEVQFCSYGKANKSDNCPTDYFCSLDGSKDNGGVCCRQGKLNFEEFTDF